MRHGMEVLLRNVFFDTCVYHQSDIDLLLKVIPADNVLFASEIFGAVKGVDPEKGFHFDDTRRSHGGHPAGHRPVCTGRQCRRHRCGGDRRQGRPAGRHGRFFRLAPWHPWVW